MRLLIVEKSYFGERLIINGLLPSDTDIVSTYGMGLWQYKLENLSFTDIPFTNNQKKLTSRINSNFSKILYRENGEVVISKKQNGSKSEDNASLDKLIEFINSRLDKYEEIIVYVDADRTGIWSAKQLIDQLSQESLPKISVMLYTKDIHEKSKDGDELLINMFNERMNNDWQDNEFVSRMSMEQSIKSTFDYWWNTNSKMVLSELCKWTGLKSNNIMSKFELMMICIISNKDKKLSRGEVSAIMSNWKGTGKHTNLESWLCVIGSPMSRSTILENAIDRGAIELSEDKMFYKISQKGIAFVARLHKKTFDPDLPFRLEKWIESNDLDSCKKYIRTIFGRQIRFQRNQIKCWGIVPALINQLTSQCSIIPIITSKSFPSNCGNEFLLKSIDGVDKGILEVDIGCACLYRAKVIFNGNVICDYVSEFNDKETRTIGCEDWVKKIMVLWQKKTNNRNDSND